MPDAASCGVSRRRESAGWLKPGGRRRHGGSGEGGIALPTILLLTALIAAGLAGRMLLPAAPSRPWLSLTMTLLLALVFGAQRAAPSLLAWFERDATAIGGGQFYRLFTALWFQDGGLAGAIFNLTTVLIVGSLAEMLWGRRDWLLVYFGTGLAIEILALWWHPTGAGNSIACCGLAGRMLISSGQHDRPLLLRAVQIPGLCAGLALALQQDIHGAALLLGAGLGLLLYRAQPTKASAEEA